MKKLSRILLSLFLLLISNNAYAVLTIDITRGNIDPMPLALPYLGSQNKEAYELGKKIIEVVENDLEKSGLFRSVARDKFLQEIQSSNTVPDFISWRYTDISALLTGGISLNGDEFQLEFRLWDVFSEQQMVGKSYGTKVDNWRRIAHLISDAIYTRITGESGYFDTRIVYVSESGPATKRIKRLAIMDQDGANHRYLTDGRHLVLTPRFSSTAQKVIYMSYVGDVPQVYMLDVDSKKIDKIGNFKGMSYAPRFSPDGKTIVMSASLHGNSEIYSMNIKTKQTTRLTDNGAIDTSPSYSPDGNKIVFNSDRGGTQQLYIMDANGKNVNRISFGDGRYGTPVWSPRGDMIAFTKMKGGKFYIGVMRIDGTGERLLTESFMDEGPTWSPNGRVIMFARQKPSTASKSGAWRVYSVDLTGYNEHMISTPLDASDPAWSPLL
jgi:TolB protein